MKTTRPRRFTSQAQQKGAGLSRRKYASTRGVTENAVRKHLASGALLPALLPDNTLDVERADAILAASVTRGAEVPGPLADARQRKLRAQTTALADKVRTLRDSLVPPADVKAVMREAWLFCARHLGTLVPHGARLAGAAPAAAYKDLDGAVFDALTYLTTTDIMGEESAVLPEPPPPATLCTLSATELAAFKANLEGEWLELRRKRERGELVRIDAQYQAVRRSAYGVPQRAY